MAQLSLLISQNSRWSHLAGHGLSVFHYRYLDGGVPPKEDSLSYKIHLRDGGKWLLPMDRGRSGLWAGMVPGPSIWMVR